MATEIEPIVNTDVPTVPERPVHPLADQFPLLEGEELDALVEDIRQNGLLNPIVLDQTGVLIDGRNRLRACQLAGVEPTFITTDRDPVAYIFGANVNRRHLTKGQQAMAFAIAYPEATDKGGRGKTAISNMAVSADYVTKARFVLRHAPQLVVKVMGGSSLPDAYTAAAEQKRQREEYETTRNAVADHVDAIAALCASVKSGIDRPDTAFIDQEDFLRTVGALVKDIREHLDSLAELSD